MAQLVGLSDGIRAQRRRRIRAIQESRLVPASIGTSPKPQPLARTEPWDDEERIVEREVVYVKESNKDNSMQNAAQEADLEVANVGAKSSYLGKSPVSVESPTPAPTATKSNMLALPERAKTQFEADSDDESMDAELEEQIDNLSGAAGPLNLLARATNVEADSQNATLQHVSGKVKI